MTSATDGGMGIAMRGTVSGAVGRSKALVFAAFARSGIAWIVRNTVQRRRVTILAYHDPDPDVLDRHLSQLGRRYSFVPLSTAVQALRSGDVSTLPRKPLVVSLDDGWAGNARLLEVARRHGVTPALFACSAIVGTARHFWWTHVPEPALQERVKDMSEEERDVVLANAGFQETAEYAERQALTLDELVRMSDVVEVEAHSRHHPVLTWCDPQRLRDEVAGCAEDLERALGRRPIAFAYPNGDCSDREAAAVSEAGYVAGLTVYPGFNGPATDPMTLRRMLVHDDAGADELLACAAGVYVPIRALGRALRRTTAPAAPVAQ